jgi:hypothetical protein
MSSGIKIYPARAVFALLTIACMVGIFMFSMDNSDASSSKSGTVTEAAVEVFVRDYDDLSPDKQIDIFDHAEHIIRKIAHFSIYTVLGFMASLTVGKRKVFSRGSLFTLIFCMLYACSDEIHQYFVPGRSCQLMDVFIDTSGAVTGMLFSFIAMALVSAIIRHKRNKNEEIPR